MDYKPDEQGHGLLGNVGTRLADVVLGNRGRCSYGLYGAMGMVARTGCRATLPCAQHLACYTIFVLHSSKGTGLTLGS
jgi:hypothetical protein